MSDQPLDSAEQLSAADLQSIAQGIDDMRRGNLALRSAALRATIRFLQRAWSPAAPAAEPEPADAEPATPYPVPDQAVPVAQLRERPASPAKGYPRPAYGPPIPRWKISLTDQFVKDTAGADARLRGRIFNAMTELSETPDVPRGDTIKPPTASRKGLWRYRIGSFRLIYQPNPKASEIVLISFAGRGSAYDD